MTSKKVSFFYFSGHQKTYWSKNIEIKDGWVNHSSKTITFKNHYLNGTLAGNQYHWFGELDLDEKHISGTWHQIGHATVTGTFVADLQV